MRRISCPDQRRAARRIAPAVWRPALQIGRLGRPPLSGVQRVLPGRKIRALSPFHAGVRSPFAAAAWRRPRSMTVDQLSLDELMTRMRDLVQRMRAGRIRSSEMADPTITVSSLGERGVEALYGIIYPPQVAIVGFGKRSSRGPGSSTARSRHVPSSRSPSRPIIGSATATPARCFSPKSASCCRSRTNYEH